MFEICFFVHLTSCLIGWNRKLDDFHGFRQCQTAISTYYTVKDGFHLNYETPVLGKPWSIPFEFPLYQWLVAATVMAFHTPMDSTGRFWSLIFFYLALFPLFSLLGLFVHEKEKRLLLLCFVLLNPTYLFWSRTFMMESLSLFLGLLYIWASARALASEGCRVFYLFLASFLGTLAGLVKITTWVSCCLPCALLVAWFWIREKRSEGWVRSLFKPSFYGLVFFMIPFWVTLRWTWFADDLKKLNPMADGFLTSNSLQGKWIFGPFSQRISPYTWRRILDNTHFLHFTGWWNLGLVLLLVLVGVALVIAPGRRTAQTVCFACFMFPLLVFTNLYFVHDYYLYANVFFLSLFLGFTALSLLEEPQKKIPGFLGFLSIPLTLVLFYAGYLSYYRIFLTPRTPTEMISRIIRETTGENDVLLIYGLDWDPTIPYYSRRRALMDRWDMPLDSPKMRKAVESLGDDRIQGMLVCGWRSPKFILDRVKFFHLSVRPFAIPGGLFFPPKSKKTSEF